MGGTVLLETPGPLAFARHLSVRALGRLLTAARLGADARLLWTEWTQGAALTSLYRVLRVAIRSRRDAETAIFMHALRLRSDRMAQLHRIDGGVCFSHHLCFPLDDDEPLLVDSVRVRAPSLTTWILKHMQPTDSIVCIPGRVFALDALGLQALLHACQDVLHTSCADVDVGELLDFCTEHAAATSAQGFQAAKIFVLLCMLDNGKRVPALPWLRDDFKSHNRGKKRNCSLYISLCDNRLVSCESPISLTKRPEF